MPWMNVATLLSVLRRRRIDVGRVEVYVEEEAIGPHPRNPQTERFQEDGDSAYDDDEYEEEED